ncbi:DMT family transporter [Tropicibacter sp. Alg240-R139]|uniref:DMT family transporter n=1 Tax=Tropicibacter sp. Alg240-R139 TaxID=2305991 RepID=UPI001F087737|nr:DMT family transporter [Tropicibacter sp. Alg240-R139]
MSESSAATTTNTTAGILWMLAAGLSFVVMTALVKSMGATMHPTQSAFLRYLLGLVFFVPALGTLIRTRLTARQWGLFSLRGAIHSVAVMLWFFAMTQIPLAEVTAMNYLTPVYVTIGAALFLGETMAARRITAIIVALIGAMIILRPGFREISPGHLAMLGTTLGMGVSYLMVKMLVEEISPVVVVAMMSIFVTIGIAPFAITVWVTPTLPQLAILFAVASFATGGHYFMTLAMQAAPVAVTQPVTFLQLIWATLLGVLIFDEGVDMWVVFGGTLILAAISFITWREAVLKRREITPNPNSPKL